jgi:translocation and assembly module TamA
VIVRPTGQEAALDACAQTGNLCRLAFLEQRFAFDQRDNPVEPHRGYYLGLSLQEGSQYLGGIFDYVRLLPEVRAYVPFDRHVLAARVMSGLLWPRGASSVLTRFFLGGSSSQRGFGIRELSPRLVVENTGGGFQALPIGGDGMIAANLEARLALPAGLGLVAFLDAGDVEPSVSDLRPRDLQIAVGAGLRYRTPVGPVRLDFGWRLNKLDFYNTLPGPGVTADTGVSPEDVAAAGGLPATPRFAIHFSIGEAF